jgi:hypothetical protein
LECVVVAAEAAADDVVAVATIENVIATAASQHIEALAAVQTKGLGEAIADQDVVALRTLDVLDVLVTVTKRLAGVVGGIDEIDRQSDQRVGIAGAVETVAALHLVLAGSADQDIGAAAAIEDVVLGAAIEDIVVDTADQRILARPAEQLVVAFGVEQEVVAAAAVQDVIAQQPEQRVGLAVAVELVVEIGAPQVLDADEGVAFGIAGVLGGVAASR